MTYTQLKHFKQVYAEKYALFVQDLGPDADAAFSQWVIWTTPEGAKMRDDFLGVIHA